ncbi:MAG: sodium/proton-translocating pyrophosphatase, partial [Acidimicrobiales bacterium]|nr:sodium/proton-translocating pyrophosphatase [Acidimicrobiales bacterium]
MGGLLCSLLIYYCIKKAPAGNPEMVEIAEAIHEGAMTFLKREYSILAGFIVIVFVLLFVFVGANTAYAFLAGSICSILAGYTGMNAATHANVRTAQAASEHGQGQALNMAFSGGAVMGLAVAGLGLFGVGALAMAFGVWKDVSQASTISGFAMGASSIALFARVGGGIFTKTADVGADLVGKVEAGLPEDDPRNPAVIADNVGDNV